MRFYEIRQDIAAPRQRVWAALTDARRLVTGGLGVTRIDGEIAKGAQLRLWSETAPKRAFALRVTEFVPPARLVWEGGMPLGLFRGERQFNLAETAAGTTLHMREEFTGHMMPLIWGSMRDLDPSFRKFAAGLKMLSEA